MCPVEPPEGNGHVLEYRIRTLEHRVKNLEEGTKLLADFGSRHNAQINDLREDVHDMKPDVAKVPVLETKVDSLLDGWRAVRNAFFAAAGGLVILAASIVYQATS